MDIALGGYFVAMFIGGETVLIPLVYLSIIGTVSSAQVILLALSASLLSDTVWYLVGRTAPNKTHRWIESHARYRTYTAVAADFMKHYGLWWVAASKFVYGTRTLTQIIAGWHKLPYLKYAITNLLATSAWICLIYGIALASFETLEQWVSRSWQFSVWFGIIFFIFTILILWTLSRNIKKHLSQ